MSRPAKSVLFYSKSTMNYVMFHPIAQRLRAEGRVKIHIVADDYQKRDVRRVYEPFQIPPGEFISKLRAWCTKFDVYISADAQIIRNRCRHKVHIFHGISFKGKSFSPRLKEYDRLFIFGEYHRRRYHELGLFPHDSAQLVVTGMPKSDCLFDQSLDPAEIRRRAGADPAKPTVLYAPTWSTRSSFIQHGKELIESVAGLGVNFIVKLHDRTRWPNENKSHWEDSMTELRNRGLRFTLTDELNVMPLLLISDVLISDASSVANEFTLLDRPIIFVDVPDLFEHYRDTVDLETWGRKTGEVVLNAAEAGAAVRRALNNPAERGEIRRAAAADYFAYPGCATGRAVEKLYQLIDAE